MVAHSIHRAVAVTSRAAALFFRRYAFAESAMVTSAAPAMMASFNDEPARRGQQRKRPVNC
jgi:hypothetical protein